jgi:hypothetical protein
LTQRDGFRVTLGHSVQYDKRKEKCFNPNSRRREVSNGVMIEWLLQLF